MLLQYGHKNSLDNGTVVTFPIAMSNTSYCLTTGTEQRSSGATSGYASRINAPNHTVTGFTWDSIYFGAGTYTMALSGSYICIGF